MADQAIRGGAPARFGWYIAFGLMTTLVWLYIEILRLLSYFREYRAPHADGGRPPLGCRPPP